MADDFTVTQGVGTTIRAVEKTAKKHQVVVLDLGGAGAENLATTNIPITGTVTAKGNGFSVPVTLTVTNGAYSVGDVVGGLITLAGMASGNGKRGIINTVKLGGVVAIPYELWFFTADIATPVADNGTFTLVAADELLNEGVIPISSNDYFAAQSSHNIASVRGCGMEYQTGAATTTLYAYMKATAVTSPGTTTLYLKVYGEWID